MAVWSREKHARNTQVLTVTEPIFNYVDHLQCKCIWPFLDQQSEQDRGISYRNYLRRNMAVLNVEQNGFLACMLISGCCLRLQWLFHCPLKNLCITNCPSDYLWVWVLVSEGKLLNKYVTPSPSFLSYLPFVGDSPQEFEETFNTASSEKWGCLGCLPSALKRTDRPLCCVFLHWLESRAASSKPK